MTRSRHVGQVYGERHPAARLTESAVFWLRMTPPRDLIKWAKKKGVALNTASQALHGVTWKHMNDAVPPVPVDRSAVGTKAARVRHARRRAA